MKFANGGYGSPGMSVDPASQHAGGYGQTAAPVAMTDTGYQNAAQPGPAVNPSPQWVAQTQGAPAGPDLPGVQWQVPHQAPPPQPMQSWGGAPPALYAGPGQPQYAAYGAAPQIVYGWYGDAGWQYKLMSDNTIYATGQANNTTYTDKPLAPGSAGHSAVVEEWLRLHAAQISTPIGQKFLQMRAGATPGLVSSVVGALRDAASTITGGMVAPSKLGGVTDYVPQIFQDAASGYSQLWNATPATQAAVQAAIVPSSGVVDSWNGSGGWAYYAYSNGDIHRKKGEVSDTVKRGMGAWQAIVNEYLTMFPQPTGTHIMHAIFGKIPVPTPSGGAATIAPSGQLVPAPPYTPPPSSNRGLMIAGGVLLALAAAGGAYWMFADGAKKNPEDKGE